MASIFVIFSKDCSFLVLLASLLFHRCVMPRAHDDCKFRDEWLVQDKYKEWVVKDGHTVHRRCVVIDDVWSSTCWSSTCWSPTCWSLTCWSSTCWSSTSWSSTCWSPLVNEVLVIDVLVTDVLVIDVLVIDVLVTDVLVIDVLVTDVLVIDMFVIDVLVITPLLDVQQSAIFFIFHDLTSIACQLGTVLGPMFVYKDQRPIVS